MKRLGQSIAALVTFLAALIAVVQYTTGYQYFYELVGGKERPATAIEADGASPASAATQPSTVAVDDGAAAAEPKRVDEWTAADTSQGYRLFVHPAGFSLKIPLQFERRTKQGDLSDEWEFQTADGAGSVSVRFTEDAAAQDAGSVDRLFAARRAEYGLAKPEYSRVTERWYVLSDYDGDTEFYECASRFRHGAKWGWARFVVRYPRSASARFDGEIQTLFESFRDSSAGSASEG